MSSKRQKYRRTIEIYFVLYLAALIFLIPTKQEQQEEQQNNNWDTPFTIKLEKSALFCRLSIDTIPEILFIDSLNTIYFAGDVQNIQYEVVIEDQVYKNKLKLVSNLDNKNVYFRLIDNLPQKIAYFYWKPPTFDKINKSYVVYVYARATDTRTGAELTARAQFALVVNYYDRKTGLPIIQKEIPEQIVQNNTPQINLGDVNFSLQYDRVKTLAYFDWENTIFVLGGLNPMMDLQKGAEISINHNPDGNGGSAYIANYSSNSISVKGSAPNFGNIVVNLKFKRKIDNREFQISFPVVAEPVANPDIPDEMFPGLVYKIKPNLPELPGYETKILVRENQTIRYQQFSNETFTFIPENDDTSKNIYIERYVNNKLIGQRIKLNIRKFPSPVIVKLSKTSANTIIVQTNSFGIHQNRENTIIKLEIQGNASYKERIGQFRADREKLIWTQFFEITPRDPSRPFSFKVVAIDRRGESSNVEIYENP